MYLRYKRIRKNGKTHTYWVLVRSVRIGGKVRQETVATLGKLDARERRRARAFADKLTGRRMHPSLFEPIDEFEADAVTVKLKAVRVERPRRFGDVYVGLTLWHALQLDDAFERLMPEGNEDIRWSTLAAIQAICRLCMPSSDLHIAESLYRQTALDDLLGVPEDKINDDRLYRTLDRVLVHKEAIEQHLRDRLGQLFSIKYDLLLYDVTSTYFEGLALGNQQARRGHSRDHRPDCKQVCIALVVTRDGIPLAHEVFEGNRVDVTTVQEIVTTIEARFGAADRVWVMDRGMASKENFAWLASGGRRYVIGACRSDLRRFEQDLIEAKDWQRIRDDVEVKLCASPDGDETFILCRSENRKEKDRAIVGRAAVRLASELDRLRNRLAKAKKVVDRDRVNQQIGRMLARHSRAAKRFLVQVQDNASNPSGLELIVEDNQAWQEWSERSAGCYLLRSNVSDWTEEELWRTYIQLTDAEAAFRIQKSDLSIRPVWHQREDRVRAHIFVCFLAYAMWKTLELWQAQAGLGNSPRMILEELRQVQSADVVLPVVDGPEIKVRCVIKPNEAHAAILDRLGIELPRRLAIPKALQAAVV
ncbi:MAG: IS1634 family transposase [Solirubrobacterales bacterium]|nr:IS1634 family transposase [Solirubrobacterales bacterium]